MADPEADPGGVPPRKVLVAEDAEALCKCIAWALAKKGMEVTTVRHGAQAMATICDRRFDAVVLDLVLPGMAGLSVIQEMRRRGLTTPAVLISGYVGLLDENRFRDLGVSRVFGKPFGLKLLAEAVWTMASSENAASRPNVGNPRPFRGQSRVALP